MKISIIKAYISLKYAIFLLLMLTFQGCPGDVYDIINTRMAYMYYSDNDSLYIRSYFMEQKGYSGTSLQKEEKIANSTWSTPARNIYWYCPDSANIAKYNKEYHNLHIRKLSEGNPCYILLGDGVIINDSVMLWDEIDRLTSTNTTDSRYTFEQIIDSLLLYHPNYVYKLDNNDEVSIYSDLITPEGMPLRSKDKRNKPSIIIN